MTTPIRVRFAPSPTGFMHVANVRVALLNWLFAKKHQGTFVLRIEDTDQNRLLDPDGQQIQKDLVWLGLGYDKGPFFQSQHTKLYQEHLDILIKKGLVYPCFCTQEHLERKRTLQIAAGKPPRYDRSCMALSPDQIDALKQKGTPCIWRLRVPHKQIVIKDIARGEVQYDLSHFSDCSLTRADGSFTFIFANFVDDLTSKISHVIRGEDHLTNTAHQAVLYEMFDTPIPVFYHVPLMVNREGKKLSKREFGTSLKDLSAAGFLPDAILNYLGIISLSLKEEVLSREQLIHVIPFDQTISTSSIHYDLEKLRWINQKWIQKLSLPQVQTALTPFFEAQLIDTSTIPHEKLERVLTLIQPELHTLAEAPEKLKFMVSDPSFDTETLLAQLQTLGITKESARALCNLDTAASSAEAIIAALQARAKELVVSNKQLFQFIRLVLTGSASGIGIKDLCVLLDLQTIARRFENMKSVL
ncbi:MAG: Glutamate-tRNA ligase [candidate division TM6 bacterium GW2011_GWE2_41_16]|nr:MAG: Glutamate-tRNA ligase [candidate division TM6 bacterium GW2011_GWE2_41_16]